MQAFRNKCFQLIKKKNYKNSNLLISRPRIYICDISNINKRYKKIKPLIFAQHRCHSTYLSFGGNIENLINELIGNYHLSISQGKSGSASIYSKKINMYGHDGHMGTQVPIGIGACFTSKKPTIVFMGDASAEKIMF